MFQLTMKRSIAARKDDMQKCIRTAMEPAVSWSSGPEDEGFGIVFKTISELIEDFRFFGFDTPVIQWVDKQEPCPPAPDLLDASKAVLACLDLTMPDVPSDEARTAIENLDLAVKATTTRKSFFAT